MSRPVVALAFAALASILAGSAAADQNHVTATVAAGAQSGPITIPVIDSPVSLICVNKAAGGDLGIGNASIVRPSTVNYLFWSSYDFVNTSISFYSNGASAIQHIVYCDTGGVVEIQSLNAAQIQVNNKGTISASVEIMFVY